MPPPPPHRELEAALVALGLSACCPVDPDVLFGPCLEAPPATQPEVHPCLSEGPRPGDPGSAPPERVPRLSPCLKVAPPRRSEPTPKPKPKPEEKSGGLGQQDTRERWATLLPEDVVQRLFPLDEDQA